MPTTVQSDPIQGDPAQAEVWYVELRGPDALTRLGEWLERLPTLPGFVGAELLSSPAQPELALVASRWATEVPNVGVPDGAKHWIFRVERSV